MVQTSDRPYYDDIDKISYKLTKDQWDSFWSHINQIDVWNWKKDYFSEVNNFKHKEFFFRKF